MTTKEDLQELAAKSADLHFNMKHEGEWYAHYYGYIYGYQEAEQKLNIASVSGKRPDLKEILIAYKNEHIKLSQAEEEILAACASGAVDKTVSGGVSDEYARGWQDAMIEVERQGLNKLRG